MLIGLLSALLSGICLGLFLAPMRLLKEWEWENFWAVWSVIAMLLGPFAVALWSIPRMNAIYHAIGASILVLTLVVGAVAGMSGFLYSLSIPVIGLGLATGLNAGSGMATSLLPLVALHASSLAHRSGQLTLAGILLAILGISICAKAGSLRQRKTVTSAGSMPDKKSRVTFVKAVIFCVIAGIIASGINLGLAFPNRMYEIARKFGASDFGVANTFVAPYLIGGFFSNFVYALWHLLRRKTFHRFWVPGTFRNAVWSIVMGLLFVLGIYTYVKSVSLLGLFGAIVAWGIFTASMIVTSNLWDVFLKEWKGKAARIMASGVGILIIAVVVLGFAQYFHQIETLK